MLWLSGACHFGNPASQTKTETLTDLIRVRGLWFYLVRYWLLLNRGRMGHIAAEFLPERLCVVRINLRVIASTRDRNIGHAAVEQILSAQLGVHVNEDTVGSLSLAGVAGHGIAMIEMRMLARVEFDHAATVHLQAQPPVSPMLSMEPNSRFATFSSLAGAVNWKRSPTEKLPHLLPEDRDALLSARIVSSLRAVLQFDCQPVFGASMLFTCAYSPFPMPVSFDARE
jgi:hypothetical protein